MKRSPNGKGEGEERKVAGGCKELEFKGEEGRQMIETTGEGLLSRSWLSMDCSARKKKNLMTV